MKILKLLAALLLTMYLLVACGGDSDEHAGDAATEEEHAGDAAETKEHAGDEAEKKEHAGEEAEEK